MHMPIGVSSLRCGLAGGPTALAELARIVNLAGVAANALLAGAIARKRQFDLVGFIVLAIVSGLGGGIIRDTLLQHGVPLALTDYTHMLAAVGGALFAFFVRTEAPIWRRSYEVIDAVALGCWAAAGAQRTLEVGLGWWPAVLLGTITAVGGGATRDVLLRREPTILRKGPLHATCAAIASAVLVFVARSGRPTLGMALAMVVGGGLRLAALRLDVHAPLSRNWTPRLHSSVAIDSANASAGAKPRP
jgi:uncharacterized membrane protein YeiH